MPSDAKSRLLAAAVEVFASKGYLCATIAEVCDAATANIAAVNYHFGSKENLFRHVLREAFRIANQRYPIDGGLAADAPAQDRLHAFMEAFIRRAFDRGPAGHFTRIMTHVGTREAAPDALILEEVRELEGHLLDAIFVELLHTRSKTVLAQARMNTIALSVFPTIAPRLRNALFPNEPTPAALRTFIDSQFRYALAGLETLRPRSAKQHAQS